MSVFSQDSDPKGIFHTVSGQCRRIEHLVVRHGLKSPFHEYRVRQVSEIEILCSGTVCGETDCHHIVGIRNEIFPPVSDTILGKSDNCQRRIQRQRPPVIRYLPVIQTCPDTEFPASGEIPEAERIFCIRFIRDPAVEVVLRKSGGLFIVTFHEGLPDFGKDMG